MFKKSRTPITSCNLYGENIVFFILSVVKVNKSKNLGFIGIIGSKGMKKLRKRIALFLPREVGITETISIRKLFFGNRKVVGSPSIWKN